MKIQSHAEQNWPHYQAIRNDPVYRAQCQADDLYEEIMMNMPVSRPAPEPVAQPSRNLSPKEWGEMQELRGLVLHLQGVINKHVDYKKPDTGATFELEVEE